MDLFQLKRKNITGYKTLIEEFECRKNAEYLTINYTLKGEDIIRSIVLNRIDDKDFFENYGFLTSETLVDENGSFIMDTIVDWEGFNEEEKIVEIIACKEWDNNNPFAVAVRGFDKIRTYPLLARICIRF